MSGVTTLKHLLDLDGELEQFFDAADRDARRTIVGGAVQLLGDLNKKMTGAFYYEEEVLVFSKWEDRARMRNIPVSYETNLDI
jgi:hypothetical protein